MTENARAIADGQAVAIVRADLHRPEHQRAILALTDAYARDAMGNGAPLAADVRERLVPGLQEHPTALILLAYVDESTLNPVAPPEPAAVGIATCFIGFSTFLARPLVNIHDLAVLADFRGRGIGKKLLAAVEQQARELGCCKMTLEVLENNHRAKQLYLRSGFGQVVHDPKVGGALFFAKAI